LNNTSGIRFFLISNMMIIILLLSASCKIGQISKDFKSIKKDAQQISKDIKTVRGAFTPVDTAMMEAMSGVLTKLSDTISENQMDSIAARINRILVKYLNDSFKNLDPGPMGQHLAQGAMQPILDPVTEQRLQEMIHSVSQKASDDLTAAMRNMMNELGSAQSKAKLNGLLLSLFSHTNSDSLSGFINRSIANVDFEVIGHRIAEELLEGKVKPQVDSISRMAVRSIFEEIQKDKNAKGFFSDIRNLLILGIGMLGLVMAILFWINRKKAMDMNKMFIHAIEDMEGKHAIRAKKAVENQARLRGLLPNVDKMMLKETMKSLSDADTSVKKDPDPPATP
jgi:hypothetical protein